MSTKQGPIKASLKIALYAGSTVVAESEDAALWQNVLIAITKQVIPAPSEKEKLPSEESFETIDNLSDPIQKLAKQLNISVTQLQGACAPSVEAPYLYLDNQHWEAFKKKVPARGMGAVSNIAIPATILCLWFKQAKINGQPTIKDCQAVLSEIGAPEANPSRSLKNTSWLQSRNGGIIINPAETSKAVEVARMFCLKGQDTKV